MADKPKRKDAARPAEDPSVKPAAAPPAPGSKEPAPPTVPGDAPAKPTGDRKEAPKSPAPMPGAGTAPAPPAAPKATPTPDGGTVGPAAAPATPRTEDAKPAAKPADAKPAAKPAEAKPAEAKPAEAKPADAKPAASPADAKPAAKPAEAPAPQPTGDYAMLRDAHAADVVAYQVLEDGAGVLHVSLDGLLPVASEAKAMGYTILSVLSAYDRGDHFGVLYAFVKPARTPDEFGEVRLRITMPKKDAAGTALEPACPSLVPVFLGADWQEREMYDMYGIRFVGHPDLRRMFLPDEWTGWPMRKDYKEPEQFVAMRDGEDIVVRNPEEGAW